MRDACTDVKDVETFFAAITMAGVLTVTRPHMNGPGGDVFMKV